MYEQRIPGFCGKAKTFACVELKNRDQAEILAVYEARKGEFTSLMDFVEPRAKESEWVQRMRRKFRERG